ncbi:MAG TPA: universal stress protein [Gemmatimonadaceae bacterium]|nr:universal stress protein [Gemmatimonadaceae bacterium]
MSGILLATHGGESADGAARIASLLARRLDVRLHALAVLQPIALIGDGFSDRYMPTAEDIEAAKAALLEAVTAQLGRCGVHDCDQAFRFGVATSEIASAAQALGASLIVAGLGSHHIIDRALGGETALHLAQVAATPVLAMPAHATAIPRRAMVALDFSPTSLLAARTVAHWLQPGDALHLVHVVTQENLAPHARALRNGDESGVVRLGQLGASLRVTTHAGIDTAQIAGDPARALLECAREIDADLIALGSHGYGIWKRLLLGSVASKLIRLSPRAVLVVPVGCLATMMGVEAHA